MLSIFDLPQDDGALPGGLWNVQLADALTDAFAGARFEDGRNVEPLTGRALKRLCCFQRVVGAVRVEGDACDLGDVSALKPAPVADAAPEPADQPADDIGTADTEPPRKARK